jgi:hypothetical protein
MSEKNKNDVAGQKGNKRKLDSATGENTHRSSLEQGTSVTGTIEYDVESITGVRMK